jgi:hypothetical protein
MSYTGSKAQSGRGTQLSIGGVTGAGGTETYTLVGEVKTTGVSGVSFDETEVSNFDSGVYKEFLATMIDPGTLDLSGNRISSDAGQIAVEAAFLAGVKYNWKMVLPINVQAGQTTTGDTYVFSGFVKSRDIPVDTSKEIGWSVKIRLSGAPTFTAGS